MVRTKKLCLGWIDNKYYIENSQTYSQLANSRDVMSKKDLSEADICTQYITPSIVNGGWDLRTQIRQEVYFTNGRIIVNGDKVERGERKRADYILYYKGNVPLAIVEAKDNNHEVGLQLK